MKTLGYHERLVNMLACVTATEPYCLVVEFCSDGDLLNYLRQRVRKFSFGFLFVLRLFACIYLSVAAMLHNLDLNN